VRWYSELEQLHKELHAHGLHILGFPCNQFLAQEPEEAGAVDTCVRTKFGVGFELLEKVNVNGPETHPVWQWLRLASGDAGAIGWNFTMFLIGPEGQETRRFANTTTPLSIRGDIVELLESHLESTKQTSNVTAETLTSPATITGTISSAS